MGCHSNLLAKPRSYPVRIVHEAAVNRLGDRNHTCVACHDQLHGPKKVIEKKSYEPADRPLCFDCHIDFKKEPFVAKHMAAGVDCMKCHGDSDEHAGDEESLMPPQIMFVKSVVNASCTVKGCHTKEKMKQEIGHRPFYAKAHPEKKYCTDCHGKHRIDKRKRKWDKKTRKLIWRDGYAVTDTQPADTQPDEDAQP